MPKMNELSQLLMGNHFIVNSGWTERLNFALLNKYIGEDARQRKTEGLRVKGGGVEVKAL